MRTLTIGLFGLVYMVGCGGPPADMPELGDVSGTVTLGGKPLSNALVEYKPKDSGRPSAATTDSEGYYSLQYTSDYSGAAVGEHTITVTPVDEAEENYEEEYSDGKESSAGGFPPKASDGSLTFTVEPGSNENNIDL